MARTAFSKRIRLALQLAAKAKKEKWTQEDLACAIDKIESRRKFLQSMGVLAMAPLAITTDSEQLFAGDHPSLFKKRQGLRGTSTRQLSSTMSTPVLILGGGAAGLAAGYVLQEKGVPFIIVEANATRTGGRIFSIKNYNSQGQFIDIGAELVDASHTTVLTLAKMLGVEIIELYDPSMNPESYWFHGQSYSFTDLVAASGSYIDHINSAIDDGAISGHHSAYDKNSVGLKYDNMSIAEFHAKMSGDVDRWVLELMSLEGTLEFGLDADQLSSVSLISEFPSSVTDLKNAPSEVECFRIRGGSASLTDALTQSIDASQIALGAKVVSIGTTGNTVKVTIEQAGKTCEIKADQVINTLPFTVLRQISGLEQLGLSSKKMHCIQDIGYGSNSKIIVELASKPWLTNGKIPSSKIVYSDVPSQSFWDSSLGQSGSNGILVNYTGGTTGAQVNPATPVEQTMPDLINMYPSLKAPGSFLSTRVCNWKNVPTALGSYAAMKVGQFQSFNGEQGTAELGGKILFAGEATDTEEQGYMNSAYRTGIRAANTILKSKGLPISQIPTTS